jgi:hypothetical protein
LVFSFWHMSAEPTVAELLALLKLREAQVEQERELREAQVKQERELREAQERDFQARERELREAQERDFQAREKQERELREAQEREFQARERELREAQERDFQAREKQERELREAQEREFQAREREKLWAYLQLLVTVNSAALSKSVSSARFDVQSQGFEFDNNLAGGPLLPSNPAAWKSFLQDTAPLQIATLSLEPEEASPVMGLRELAELAFPNLNSTIERKLKNDIEKILAYCAKGTDYKIIRERSQKKFDGTENRPDFAVLLLDDWIMPIEVKPHSRPCDAQRQAMGYMVSRLMKVYQLRACFDPNVFIFGLSIHGSHLTVLRGSIDNELHFKLDKSKQVSLVDCNEDSEPQGVIVLRSLFARPKNQLGSEEFPPRRVQVDAVELELRSALGFGSFGMVFRGKDASGNDFAVKMPHFFSQPDRALFDNEIHLLQALQGQGCENIIELKHASLNTSTMIFSVAQTLGGYLTQQQRNFKSEKGRRTFAKLVFAGCKAGLQCAHSLNIVHTDIRPSNILVCGDVIQIADWGLAVQGEYPSMKKKRAESALLFAADAIVNNYFFNRETLYEQSYDLEALSYVCYSIILGSRLRLPSDWCISNVLDMRVKAREVDPNVFNFDSE